jgi:adenylate cyclase
VANEASVERRLAAIFVADVVGDSRLMGFDEVALSRLKAIRRELADPAVAGMTGESRTRSATPSYASLDG